MASNPSGSQPPEITAEWTVHAQLTLSHQGSSTTCDRTENSGEPETVSRDSPASAPPPPPPSAAGDSASAAQRPSAPVKVIYKFSTADSAPDGTGSSPICGGVTFKQGSAIFNPVESAAAFQVV